MPTLLLASAGALCHRDGCLSVCLSVRLSDGASRCGRVTIDWREFQQTLADAVSLVRTKDEM